MAEIERNAILDNESDNLYMDARLTPTPTATAAHCNPNPKLTPTPNRCKKQVRLAHNRIATVKYGQAPTAAPSGH